MSGCVLTVGLALPAAAVLYLVPGKVSIGLDQLDKRLQEDLACAGTSRRGNSPSRGSTMSKD
jgi:hypothetical protein